MDIEKILTELSDIPGVSTRTERVAARCAELLRPVCDRVETDAWGNVRGYLGCGKPGAKTLMIDAHIDQVGFLVNGILKEGFLSVQEIGLDMRLLAGMPVLVHTAKGVLHGVTVPRDGRLNTDKAAGTDKLVIDTGLTAGEVEAAVHLGDPVTFANSPFRMAHGRVCCNAIDDRACFTAILLAAEKLSKETDRSCDLVFSGADREELGGPSANVSAETVQPDLFLAVDVCHANSRFSSDSEDMGKGPSIPHEGFLGREWSELFETLAKEYGIPVQRFTYGYFPGTNAGEVMFSGTGHAGAGLSLPMRYMHTAGEVIEIRDIETTAELLYRFAMAYGREA